MAPVRPFSLRVLEFDQVKELLARHLASPLGRTVAQACAPLTRLEEARRAQEETTELARLRAAGIGLPPRDFPDCRPLLAGLREGGVMPGPDEMGRLLLFLQTWARVHRFLRERGEECPRLAALAGEREELAGFRERLVETVDVRGRVHDGASPRLYTLRRFIEEEDRRLHACLRRLTGDRGLARHLRSTQVSWRGGRPVLQVRAENRGRVEGIVHDRSQSGGTLFVEPREAVPLANRLAELRSDERAEISRLLAELIKETAAREEELERCFAAAGSWDFVCAKAEFMARHELAIPEIAAGWPLRIQGARHPVLAADRREGEGSADSVVPLDLILGEDYDTVVVTGPNTGGKTVALKCVGLLATMALAGLPVFARRARVPLVEAVFADIGDEQEISQNLSTFSGHLRRVVGILEGAGPEALVLLDELGAGTDPAEGGVLGYAVLERLLALRAKVLATTHIGVLKTFALNHPRAVNGAMEFDPETLDPLFRLCIGMPGLSNALAIARRLGLDPEVLARAEAMIDRPEGGVAFLVEKLQESRLAAERSRANLEKLEGMADERVELLQEQSRILGEREKVLHMEADQRAHDCLRRARSELEERLKPLLQLSGRPGEQARQAAAAAAELLRWSPLARQREAFLAGLRKGDTVRVPRFRFRGPLTRLMRNKQRAEILRGGIPIEVSFDDIIPDDEVEGNRPGG